MQNKPGKNNYKRAKTKDNRNQNGSAGKKVTLDSQKREILKLNQSRQAVAESLKVGKNKSLLKRQIYQSYE